MAENTMRAALVTEAGGLRAGERPAPEPGPGELLIRVEACGICGSDLHFLHERFYAPGHTPGHEIAGRVERAGPGASGPAPGTRVAVEPLVGCGECAYCLRGDPQVCREMRLYGVHHPGGLAEWITVPAACAHPLDDEVDPAVGALAEPLAVAVHGLRRGRLEAGQRVLVLGAGTVGLAVTVAARALGAEVFQSARYEQQAKRAQDLGAQRVLREEEAEPTALAGLAREVDFDVVVETVGGRADTLRAACFAMRPGGTTVVLGVHTAPPVIEPMALLMSEGTLVWSNCYGTRPEAADFPEAVRIVLAERERLAPLVTHPVSLAEVDRALAAAHDKQSGAVKVSILPGGYQRA